MGKPLEITVGGVGPYDPVSGATVWNNPLLAGQDIWIERYGFGPIPFEDYQVQPAGGFQLLNGVKFGNNGDIWFAHTTGLSVPQTGVYSNGFQQAPVVNALVSRIGWLQPTLAGSPVLAAPNTVSNGGRYFNDGSFHGIVNPNTIKSVQEDPALTDAQFNALLLVLQKSAIMRSLNGVFNKAEILEKKLLFERFGRQDYPDTHSQTPIFVGVRILAPRSFDRTVQIDSLALRFSANVSFNFYLFHDTQPGTPIATIPVTAIGGQQTIVNLNQFVLNYSALNKSGYYYFGYFQRDLGAVTAINEILELFNECNNFGCAPIELQQVGSGINPDQVSFTIKTHGFNLQFTAFRDHTQSILSNAFLFDELIGLQMAAMTIEMIQTSIRSNKDERLTKELTAALYRDLNMDQSKGMGDYQPVIAGIKSQINREVNRVKCEFYPKKKVETNTHDTESFNPYGIPEIDLFRY